MDNSYKFDVSVYDVYNHMSSVELDFTVVVDADADMVRVAPWAKFAVAYGKWFLDQKPEGLTFLYKKTSDDQWISVPSSAITFDEAGKTFSADITGLEPSAQYVIKAVSATDTETREMSFSTLDAPQLYNMNFDDAKKLLKEAIDEAETQGDILRIWIEKIYQQGKKDSQIDQYERRQET